MSIPKLNGAKLDIGSVDASQISVFPGQFVTVYLHHGNKSIQCELHVTKDGIPRVLLDEDDVASVVGTYDDVYGDTQVGG